MLDTRFLCFIVTIIFYCAVAERKKKSWELETDELEVECSAPYGYWQ